MPRSINLRFGDSPAQQQAASTIVSAMRDGMIERGQLAPSNARERKLRSDHEKSEIKRILLFGLNWHRDPKTPSRYRALDLRTDREHRIWIVQRMGKVWVALCEGEPTDPKSTTTQHPSMRAARTHCEERARRLDGWS